MYKPPKSLSMRLAQLFLLATALLIEIPLWREASAAISCSQNAYVANDLIAFDAMLSHGNLQLSVTTRQSLSGIAIETSRRFDFFIDADQSLNTGDPRPGAIQGIDYVVRCRILIAPLCTLYRTPSSVHDEEQSLGNVPAEINPVNVLSLTVPVSSAAVDVIAFARGGNQTSAGVSGHGDRCPEHGAFNTATQDTVVRRVSQQLDRVISDSSGSTLQGWRFRTIGDQFEMALDFKSPVSLDGLNGRLELDTDRNLNTGLVHTPFLIASPFNEIASWGWDIAIEFTGGDPFGASDPTPIWLDFGKQSDFILPGQSYAYPYGFPFGEGYNDGRWHFDGNRFVMQGSLAMLDARRWRTVPGEGLTVDRIPTDGQWVGRLFTRAGSAISDMIPKRGSAFDFVLNQEAPAISWKPESMVSGSSPLDRLPQYDLIRVDAQVDSGSLVVAGTIARLESSWMATGLIFFIDTDGQTGQPIRNEEYQTETILADYVVGVVPRDLWGFVGYTALLRHPDEVLEGRDSGLNIQFSDPAQVSSPARFTMTIPLTAIGNPQGTIRLYVATVAPPGIIDDVAPLAPLSVGGGTTYTLTVDSSRATGVAITANLPTYGGTTKYSRGGIASGTGITLTAPATAGGANFSSWSGCASTADRDCTVAMTQNRTVTVNYTSTTCPYDDHLPLQNTTVTGTEFYGACRTLTAGPAFVVTASGDATFLAGQRITLRPGFAVRAGGRFRARIDPSLASAAPDAAVPGATAEVTVATPAATPWPPAAALTWSDLPEGLRARLREHDATVRDARQSADGAVIVFASDAALVAEDDNAHSDVYAYAADTDTLWLISATLRGAAGAGPSHTPRLDGEGRHLLYVSVAPDLVAGPSNAYPQIYHHDLELGRTALLTRTGAGRPGDGASDQPLLAGDWAIYRTAALDLAPAGPGLYRQHLYDGRREAVGLDDWSQPDPRASHPVADAAGAEIAYQRPDPDEYRQIYLNDLWLVERLSRADDPELGPLDHCCAALSPDGRYLAYREWGAEGAAWLHLRDRDRDRHVRLPWPADEALAEQAPTFRQDSAELWWIAPEQGPGLLEVQHRLANPLRE